MVRNEGARGRLQPRDLDRFVSIGAVDIASDGSFAVFSSSRPDSVANQHVGQIWRVDLNDGACRRITRGVADTRPRIAPDGRCIAFLRRDDAGRAQIFVAPGDGGEPAQTSRAALGVDEFAWSPDGELIAYSARVPRAGRYGSTPGLGAMAEPVRLIDGIRWTAEGLGYVTDRPSHVFVVAAPDPSDEPTYDPGPGGEFFGEWAREAPVSNADRQLTNGEDDHLTPAFSVDGRSVFCRVEYAAAPRRDPRSAILSIPLQDGARAGTVVDQAAGLAVSGFAVAGEDDFVLLASETDADGPGIVAPDIGLWRLSGGKLCRITAPDTLDLGEYGTRVALAGDRLWVQHRARGRLGLVSIAPDGAVRDELSGDVEVVTHSAADGVAVAAVATAESAGELIVIDAGGPRQVTHFADRIAPRRLRAPVELTVHGRDGTAIHGWYMTPEGSGPFPTIVQIHGGPHSSYGVRLSDERQVLVAAGYAVVYANPRGSAGYGATHARAVRHRLGTIDHADVADFLDGALAADPRLDCGRLGIMGGSYGGFLAAWITAKESRFSAAIVERGFLDPATFRGTSDIGSWFVDQYLGPTPHDIARQSVMEIADDVRTPTLVVHSELDARCPLEQSTQYYAALRCQGVETRLLIFPGENHGFGRSGQPRHRVQRLEAILDWWRRWLPVDDRTHATDQPT